MKLKKPKFWDYQRPNLLSYFLLPLTLPIIINNLLLSLKKHTKKIKPKKICIGNIYIGGTAKTALTIKIYQILNKLNIKTGTIKKFYKSHYDEQEMLSEKTKLYCEKSRIQALAKAIQDNIDVALFDDGLQDRSINYDLKIVCFNSIKRIGNGFLIPAGPLREKINSISKYDVAFINGNEEDNIKLKSFLKKYNTHIQIFESNYKAINIKELDIDEEYIVFSGIGNPESFKQTLINNNIKIEKEIIYPDHHQYTQKDIDYIRFQARRFNSKILTTEKDYIKIKSSKNNDIKYLIILLLVFKILGLKIASFISNKITSLFGPIFRSKNLIKSNILKALPYLNQNEIDTISNKMWGNYGRILAEYVFIKDFRGPKFNNKIKVNGQDILEKIKKDNEPVIFVSGHFNNFELMALHIEKSGINLAAIYRPLNNKFLNFIMERVRKKYICKNQIKKGISGTKKLLAFFKKKTSIALMIDQRVSQGIRSKFFNDECFTTTIPAQFIKKFKCKIVPIYIERIHDTNFQIIIHEPIKFSDNETIESITGNLNNLLEKMILKNPEQWIWSHNRWK